MMACKNMKSVNIYVILLVILLLRHAYTCCLYPWMTSFVLFVWGVLCFIAFLSIYKRKPLSLGLFLPYLILSFGEIFSARTHIVTVAARFSMMLPVLSFFLIRTEVRKKLLYDIEQVFFILISISFSLYLLDKVGLLPSVGKSVWEQYDYYNYVFYTNVIRYEGAFCGFTFEAGYISLLLVILLTINEYDFARKRNWVYLAALLCTLSLGGYLMGTIGYVMQRTLKQKSLKKSLVILSCIIVALAGIVIFAFSYNGGNNILVEEILNRLMFDEELGIVGNNRENVVARELFDYYFYSDKVWLGIGEIALYKAMNLQNFDACSWRYFIIRYGAIYTMIFFTASIYFLSKTKIRNTLPLFVITG